MNKDIKNKVHFILQRVPKARDCYNTLFFEYYKKYVFKNNDSKVQLVADAFYGLEFQTIERTRREIQAENEQLRGKLYGVRKDREKLFREYYGKQ